jgi:hypothetical protein
VAQRCFGWVSIVPDVAKRQGSIVEIFSINTLDMPKRRKSILAAIRLVWQVIPIALGAKN